MKQKTILLIFNLFLLGISGCSNSEYISSTFLELANKIGKKHIIDVPLTSSNSIPHSTNGRFGAAKLILRPSAPGSGVIAGSSIRTVLELAGIKNILSKQLGSNNLLNNAIGVRIKKNIIESKILGTI